MNKKYTTTFPITGANANITITTGLQAEPEKVAVQIVSDVAYNGTTDTIKLQQSNDGTNWNDIIDSVGNVLEVTLSTNNTFMLLTSVFYCENIRAVLTFGDGNLGTLTIITTLKG